MVQVLGFVRHVLTFGGGFLVAKGYTDENTMMEGVAALMTLAGIAWSMIDKFKASGTL